MERISEKEILDQYLIMSGWKPANMRGALSLVEFVAQAQLEACEKEHLEKMKANALSYGAILENSEMLHQKAMRDLFEQERDYLHWHHGEWCFSPQKYLDWQALKDKFLKEE